MAMEFAKTAPGVMTATWTHPKNGRAYSIAVIESCGTWHTFIDGELIAREQPTFEEAVTAAERKLTRKTTSRMVRVAGVLVLASMLGASAVVASKFMPALSPDDVAAAVNTGRAAAPAAIATATPAPVAASGTETPSAFAAVQQPASSSPDTTADLPLTSEVQPLQAADRAARAAVGMEPFAPSGLTPAPGPRRFSAENNLLAMEEAAVPSSMPPGAPTPDPVATPDKAPETPAVSLANAAPRVIPMDPPPPTAHEDTSLGAEPGVVGPTIALPPIPAPAPRLAEPVAKLAASTTAADFENAAGAPRETAAGSPTRTSVVAPRITPTDEWPRSEFRASRKKAAADRTTRPRRRAYRPQPRHRETREHNPRHHAATPGRRLVCFAHVCRWR